MKGITKYPRFTIAVLLLLGCIFLLTRCIHKEKDQAGADIKGNFSAFAGSASCATCHKKISEDHIHTAHYLTSREASDKYIKGSFETGKNSFSFSDSVKVVMERRDSDYYQVEYHHGVEKKARRFDIVVGSATKGQTFLYWANDRLFQMPITYFTPADQWSNSPGYPERPVFNRPITSRCLECHSTYFQKTSAPAVEAEQFDRRQIVYGVDCEKCHGPAARHIAWQQEHPAETKARYIINPATLTRQQNLDLCALCHGGRLTRLRPSFSFTAGDKLSDYFQFDTVGRNVADIDVHGNQLGLLMASKCFQMSQMSCVTCHNTHENERGKLAVFSQRCMACHGDGGAQGAGIHKEVAAGNTEKAKPCKMTATIGPSITQNCIGCHMPKQPSRAIAVLLQGVYTPTVAQLRTHDIKVYPDQTKAFLDEMKNVRKTQPINKK